jgi:phenylpropionate dioxygenase-like ring-hydroxylating dioxygenase large terminal subunit
MSAVASEFLDGERAGGPALALPAWVYRDPRVTRLEIERVLRRSWQLVCHLNSIPKAGDFTTFDLADDSIVVLRDREGAVRAFHNVCRHRGARLLEGSGRCPGPIVCPYHGWSYGQNGALVGLPSPETFQGVSRADLGLKPVQMRVFHGFVFVCLSEDPLPFQEVWGPFESELAPYRFAEMVPLCDLIVEDWEVDWKVAMENYLESYHVPIGHPGLNRMFTPDYEDQKFYPGISRGTSWMRPQRSSRWSERFYQELLERTAFDLPGDYRRCWRFYAELPNLGLDVYPEQMDFFQVLPLGPGKCRIRYGIFGLPDDRREVRVLRALGRRINRDVNAEDRALCLRVQQGLRSSSYTPGPLSTIESRMREFHALLERHIPELRLEKAPAAFS